MTHSGWTSDEIPPSPEDAPEASGRGGRRFWILGAACLGVVAVATGVGLSLRNGGEDGRNGQVSTSQQPAGAPKGRTLADSRNPIGDLHNYPSSGALPNAVSGSLFDPRGEAVRGRTAPGAGSMAGLGAEQDAPRGMTIPPQPAPNPMMADRGQPEALPPGAVPLPQSNPLPRSTRQVAGLPTAQQPPPPSLRAAPSEDAPPEQSLRSGPLADGTEVAIPTPGSGYAVYDITGQTVYMPSGERLEAHSGLGEYFDNPRFIHVKMRGATPPNTYKLTMREALFHGVEALRMHPVGDEKMYGRDGLLTHSYLLGPRGDSNGCVSFKEYERFLAAYKRGEVSKLVVVARLSNAPKSLNLLSWLMPKR